MRGALPGLAFEQLRNRVQQEGEEQAIRLGAGVSLAVGLEVEDAAWRQAAGLPAELSVHCLRHSYISHLIEDGADPLFVQQQAGHSWASTTAVYTTVGQDARNRMLRSALDRAFGEDGR